MVYTYAYPRPMVTVDIAVFQKRENSTHILLIQRLNNPFKDAWALPGGFVDENEALIDAANRELEEETGIKNLNLIQFKAYGDAGRDPRGHNVSVVFKADASGKTLHIKAGDDARLAQWFPLNNLPNLAFDHNKIIQDINTAK